jgi:hypothetical protein
MNQNKYVWLVMFQNDKGETVHGPYGVFADYKRAQSVIREIKKEDKILIGNEWDGSIAYLQRWKIDEMDEMWAGYDTYKK